MKALLILFSIIFVIENFVIANNEFSATPLLKDLYQKKTSNNFMRGPKMVNKRISIAKKYGGIKKSEIRTKKPSNIGEYTVFPSHIKKDPLDVPSSPYFVGDLHNDEPKLRVKKVLPDFWNVHDRKKRSPQEAVKEDAPKNSDVKEDNLKKTKAEKPVVKTSAKVAKTAKPATKNKAPKGEKKKATKVSKKAMKGSAVTAKPAKSAKRKVTTKTAKHKVNKTKLKKPAARNIKPKTPKVKSALKSNSNRSRSSNKTSNNKSPVKRSRDNNQAPAKKGKESVSRRLIAARDGMIENYPYVVSIQKDGEHWCAGALLNQRLVITTANCVWKSNRMSRMKIRAGSRHLEHGGQQVAISEVLKHPAWSIRKNPDNDVALLLTDGFVKFSHTCHAVDLPNRVMMPIFDDAWIASWGAERRDGIYVKQGLTLQVYHARLLSREKCNNVTMRYGVMVTDNFICLEQIGRRAPCTRDTGAPAVSDGVLWGLASWGIRKMCGTERFPAMFSYIASESNMDFIINGTKYLMSEERLSPFLDRYPFPRSRNYSHRII